MNSIGLILDLFMAVFLQSLASWSLANRHLVVPHLLEKVIIEAAPPASSCYSVSINSLKQYFDIFHLGPQ